MLTNQPTNRPTDSQERLSVAIAQIHSALTTVNAANQRSLRSEFQHDGEACPAENSDDRAAIALDHLRTALCEVLVDSDDDPGATIRYMTWLVNQKFAGIWSQEQSDAWLRTEVGEGRKVGVMQLAAAIAAANGGTAKEYTNAALYWWRKAQLAKSLIIGSLRKTKGRVIVANGGAQ